MSAKRLSRREFLQHATATTALAVLAPHALAIPTQRRVSTMAEIQVVEMTAKPLPEKVFETEKFGISRKTHEEHYKLYQGYVNKTNEIRRALAQLTSDDFAKGNQTYSLIRSLKVDYTFAIGGVKNHELYFENHRWRRFRAEQRAACCTGEVLRLVRTLGGGLQGDRHGRARLGVARL
jgi:hypothetical protein